MHKLTQVGTNILEVIFRILKEKTVQRRFFLGKETSYINISEVKEVYLQRQITNIVPPYQPTG